MERSVILSHGRVAEGTLGESRGCSSLSQGGERGLVSHPRGFVCVGHRSEGGRVTVLTPPPRGPESGEGHRGGGGTLSTRRLWPWAAGVGLSLDVWDPGSGAQEGRRVGGPEESPLFALHPRAGPVRSAPSPAGALRRRCGFCFNCLSRHEEMPRP